MRIVPLVLAAALGLTGCAAGSAPEGPTAGQTGPTAGQTAPTPTAAATSRSPETLTLTWAGIERTYLLHAPRGYRPGGRYPLVVVMHYRDGDAETMRTMTAFDAKADAEGFLVAYPNGIYGSFNALICCGPNDDVGFIRALVQHLVETHGADPKRVYAAGISNGADMAYRLAIEAPGLFAAIAPVSGGFVGTKASDDPAFKPSRPVSVVTFLGYDDMLRPRAVAGLAAWERKLGCRAGPTGWYDPQRTVERTTAGCADGSQVVSYVVRGMGHAWPGGRAHGLGDPTTHINAVDVMWEFFRAHPQR